ncbi:MAG: PilZ domain-containing protein [Desulfobulbaceae bacterium]|nr:PilZ domain-containing protein [Desulfobulbaceae bacterium]
MNVPEQREARRIRFESQITIRTGDDTVEATADSRNISLKGIYLVPEKKIPVDTPCTLAITLTGKGSQMIVTIPGKICRHDGQGTAVTFLDMDVDSFVHLKNLIQLHSSEKTPTTPPACPGQ